MNENQLNRKARRAARKKGAKLERKLAPNEIRNLKIQKAPVWAQVLLIVLGLVLIGVGIYLQFSEESVFGFLLCSVLGLIISITGFFGKKETIERSAEQVLSQSSESFVEKIIDSL